MNSKPKSERRDCQLGVYLRQRDRDYVLSTRDAYRVKHTNRDSLSIGELLVALCIRYNNGKLDSKSRDMVLDTVRTLDGVIGELTELKERCERMLNETEGESDDNER